MQWLDSQVVALTGGGAGLGRSLVDVLVAEGARVVVLERSRERCDLLTSAFDPTKLRVINGDATSPDDNARLVSTAVEEFGRLDTFIANTGLWDFMTPIDSVSPEQLSNAFDEIYALNVKAPLLGAQAAIPALRASGGAFLVTLSNASLFPGGGGSLYVSSKHAAAGMVKQLAYELAPDIRVNGVAPGGMSTDLRGPASLGLQNKALNSLPIDQILESGTPLHRSPHPSEYAGAFVLLASRQYGRTATGTILDVSNGMGIIGSVVEQRPS